MNLLERYLLYQRAKKAYETAVENYSVAYVSQRNLHHCFEYYFNRACKVSCYPFDEKFPELFKQAEKTYTIQGELFLEYVPGISIHGLKSRITMLDNAICVVKDNIKTDGIEIIDYYNQIPEQRGEWLLVYFEGEKNGDYIKITFSELDEYIKANNIVLFDNGTKYTPTVKEFYEWHYNNIYGAEEWAEDESEKWVVGIINSRIENYEKKLIKTVYS